MAVPGFHELRNKAWASKAGGDHRAAADIFMLAFDIGEDEGIEPIERIHVALPAARENWAYAGALNDDEGISWRLYDASHTLSDAEKLAQSLGDGAREVATKAVLGVTRARYKAARNLIQPSGGRDSFSAALTAATDALELLEGSHEAAICEPEWAAQVVIGQLMIAGLARKPSAFNNGIPFSEYPAVLSEIRKRRPKTALAMASLVVPLSVSPFRRKLIEAI